MGTGVEPEGMVGSKVSGEEEVPWAGPLGLLVAGSTRSGPGMADAGGTRVKATGPEAPNKEQGTSSSSANRLWAGGFCFSPLAANPPPVSQ